MLLVVEGLHLRLAPLDDRDRIGDPRGDDVLNYERGVVGGVNLVTLAHLEGELGQVVGLVVNLGRDTGVGDLDRQDAVLVALELGRHAEVLGALDPRVDRGVLRDDRVLVGVIKIDVVVHVILGDGGNSIPDSQTHIRGEFEVSRHEQIISIRTIDIFRELKTVLFSPLFKGLS